MTTDFYPCVGKGWHPLIRPLLEMSAAVGANVLQVKEKFGTLRFYVDNSPEGLDAAIDAAEDLSRITCEECGAYGTQTVVGWIRTLCERHKGNL